MATVARPLGALPTAILATSFRVCRSTIEQSLLPVFETHPYRPSGEKAIQLGSSPTPIDGRYLPVLDVVNVNASCRHGGGPQFFAIRRKSQPCVAVLKGPRSVFGRSGGNSTLLQA